jgi:hypothetical protein
LLSLVAAMFALATAGPAVKAADNDTSSTSKDDVKIACGAAENACVQTCPQEYDNKGVSHDLYVDLCNDGCIQAYSKCMASAAVRVKVKKNTDATGFKHPSGVQTGQ